MPIISERPLLARPWWQRVAICGGYGVLAAALFIAVTLLKADIPGERAIGPGRSNGIPLWPHVAGLAMVSILGSIAVALLIPVYRYRRGGVMFGVLATIAFLVISVGSSWLTGQQGWTPLTFTALPWWQEWIVLTCLLCIVVSITPQLRPDMPETPPAESSSAERVP